MRDIVEASLDDDKAMDVVGIDLAGKTSFADHMIVASGLSSRHIAAMAQHVLTRLKAAGYPEPSIEGAQQSDWVLIDAGDVVVHLFRPETRKLYALEKMWGVEPVDEVRLRRPAMA
jgi:ribosome-associated protein